MARRRPPKAEEAGGDWRGLHFSEFLGPDDVDLTSDEEDIDETPGEDLRAIVGRRGAGGRAVAAEELASRSAPETEDGRREDVRWWLQFWNDEEIDVRRACVVRLAEVALEAEGALRQELVARLTDAARHPSETIREASLVFWFRLARLGEAERATAWDILAEAARDRSAAMHEWVAAALVEYTGPLPEEGRPFVFRALIEVAESDDQDVRPPGIKALVNHRDACPAALADRVAAVLAKYHAH
jgi:hypothetical protein